MTTEQRHALHKFVLKRYTEDIAQNPEDWAMFIIQQLTDDQLIDDLDLSDEDSEVPCPAELRRTHLIIEQLGFDPRKT